jgi:hypothetical protein
MKKVIGKKVMEICRFFYICYCIGMNKSLQLFNLKEKIKATYKPFLQTSKSTKHGF